MSSESVEGTEKVQALLIFSLAEEWRQVLLTHGCAFGVHEEYGETIQFPEGTTRTLLCSREGQLTNRYRIQLPDGLELREVLDDEGKGKSWLTLVLSQEPMQDVRGTSDVLQGKTIPGKGIDAQKKHEARALIEKAQARAGLITVLTRRLMKPTFSSVLASLLFFYFACFLSLHSLFYESASIKRKPFECDFCSVLPLTSVIQYHYNHYWVAYRSYGVRAT
jgi:hypothetical protein